MYPSLWLGIPLRGEQRLQPRVIMPHYSADVLIALRIAASGAHDPVADVSDYNRVTRPSARSRSCRRGLRTIIVKNMQRSGRLCGRRVFVGRAEWQRIWLNYLKDMDLCGLTYQNLRFVKILALQNFRPVHNVIYHQTYLRENYHENHPDLC